MYRFFIFQKTPTSLPRNTYWAMPYSPQLLDENQTSHTIHNLNYSKFFETMTPSPGIRIVRSFSFPDYTEDVHTKKRKSNKQKKIRFSSPIKKITKKKFTVTSIPESLEML